MITLGFVKTYLAWNFKKSHKSSEDVFLAAQAACSDEWVMAGRRAGL